MHTSGIPKRKTTQSGDPQFTGENPHCIRQHAGLYKKLKAGCSHQKGPMFYQTLHGAVTISLNTDAVYSMRNSRTSLNKP